MICVLCLLGVVLVASASRGFGMSGEDYEMQEYEYGYAQNGNDDGYSDYSLNNANQEYSYHFFLTIKKKHFCNLFTYFVCRLLHNKQKKKHKKKKIGTDDNEDYSIAFANGRYVTFKMKIKHFFF